MQAFRQSDRCVIGERLDFTAFVSVQAKGTVWVKEYLSLTQAMDELRRLRIVGKSIGKTVHSFVRQERQPFTVALVRQADEIKLADAGFVRSGDNLLSS